ncbi:MAG: ATP-binding protein, partial [Candidatus Nanoarchaeia archaeon]
IKKPTIIQLKQCFTKYLHYGGFPRVVLEKDVALKQELLKNYFQTIYLKDIIYPHNLRNNKDVFDLLFFMLSNAGKPFSYTSISKVLKIAVDTVKEYVKYAEEAYLMSAVTKYDPSVKKQIINPKKFYCIDTGMINAAAFQFSENRGRLLENLVYETLIRTGADVYYHKEQQECDFVIKKGLKITEAVQVTLSLKDPATRKRELKGLLEAMDKYKLKEGLIITENEQETFTEGDKTITVKSAYRWLQEINTPISMS